MMTEHRVMMIKVILNDDLLYVLSLIGAPMRLPTTSPNEVQIKLHLKSSY